MPADFFPQLSSQPTSTAPSIVSSLTDDSDLFIDDQSLSDPTSASTSASTSKKPSSGDSDDTSPPRVNFNDALASADTPPDEDPIEDLFPATFAIRAPEFNDQSFFHRHPFSYDPSLARSRSNPSSFGTFVIDDTAPGVGDNYAIEDTQVYPDYAGPKHHYTELKRALRTRHIQMIAVGGVLGNGLFVGSGKILGNSGPLGTILGFLFTGCIVFSVMVSFGEMVALIPIAGGISAFGSRFVDDSLGFALGVCYWFSLAIAIPTQISSAAVLLTYFKPFDPWQIYPAEMVVPFLLVIILINSLEVKIYGEVEYIFGSIKLWFLLGLIIFMFVINRNHIPPDDGKTSSFPVNFLFWDASKSSEYGPFRPFFEVTETKHIEGSLGRFLMIWTAVVQSVYSFSGTELVALTAGEAKTPRKSLPRATTQIFFRVFTLYMLAVFAIGLNVAGGNSALPGFFTPWSKYSEMKVSWVYGLSPSGQCDSGTISMKGYSNSNNAPWVIAFQNAGLCLGSSVVSGIFVFCAWSSGNSYLYASSRTLYAMAIQGKAPQIFGRCTKNGVPFVSVLFTFMIAMTVFLVSFPNSTTITVYYWIRKLTSVPGTLVWAGICLSYIRFYYGLKLRRDIVQRDAKSYPYRSPFQPYTAYFGLCGCFLLVIFNDMTIFIEFEWQYFFASYVSLMLFVLCFVSYKLWRRTRLVPLARMDLDLGRREMDQYEAETAVEKRTMEKGLWSTGKRWVHWIKIMLI
ncbi:amino acid permease-domain-containing protein [Lipomyces oligophaga]|uniref:amino acid permease-domain-containing protein n=1 Tax=Lipomyces oligophaga TaxID=45792 RepID=UPI0034CFD54E